MAGIYIHIPFCKQACFYCDFHFSTSTKYQDEMVQALAKELELQKHILANDVIQTIYFGGGTPSLLSITQINYLLETINKNYALASKLEITLEANPDDLTQEKLQALAQTPINRLSIGVQSFDDKTLLYMNRSHNARQALASIKQAQNLGFENITIDLIYGVPHISDAQWQAELNQAFALQVPHISAYALTVEPKTALASFIQKGKYKAIDEDLALAHFNTLVSETKKQGFVQYEISNFGKPDFFSKHNTAYWQGKKYLGIGPSAHSFFDNTRMWNVANNIKYIKSLAENSIPNESEILSKTDLYNEYLMTQLRTIWGVNSNYIKTHFGDNYVDYFLKQSKKHLKQKTLVLMDDNYVLNQKGKFLADGIISELFYID